ncbi:TauD/TfdA dioxygenase family protein [Croceibacterium aestuarii]|uniref:TauD/TfdA dioxygenase family protein n=1 Tax=Croceibacterium aestuarii TaxID=3064139 RepID=UPI00272EDD39|nr:TauD/TfdA family dioxygenase [Croceibacterium sp. D39]
MQINQLHPRFVGELVGLDTSAPISQETIDQVEEAMAKYAVCVIRDAALGDDEHLAFSRAFGPVEFPPFGGQRIAKEIYDVGNLTADGEIRPYNPDGPQPVDFERFHTDSPFNSLPTKWSLLLAYETPPAGADTQFVDLRAVYEDLPDELKEEIDGLQVDHDMFRALQRTGVEFTDEEMRRTYPRMTHPLVRTAADGRKTLYLGWHAVAIEGWEREKGEELLDRLFALAVQEKYVYSHKWRPRDLVIWDNRCTMHSATSFERYKYRRDMRRTTINEYGPEVSAIEPERKEAV